MQEHYMHGCCIAIDKLCAFWGLSLNEHPMRLKRISNHHLPLYLPSWSCTLFGSLYFHLAMVFVTDIWCRDGT